MHFLIQVIQIHQNIFHAGLLSESILRVANCSKCKTVFHNDVFSYSLTKLPLLKLPIIKTSSKCWLKRQY